MSSAEGVEVWYIIICENFLFCRYRHNYTWHGLAGYRLWNYVRRDTFFFQNCCCNLKNKKDNKDLKKKFDILVWNYVLHSVVILITTLFKLIQNISRINFYNLCQKLVIISKDKRVMKVWNCYYLCTII